MDFVASVVRGVASLTQTMEDGRRQMVGLLLPSDFSAVRTANRPPTT
jgi:CRP/FNR family transcriptional regulator